MADIALQQGILTSSVFVGIVVSALVSSLLVAPWLMWSIDRRRAADLLGFIVGPGPVPDLTAETREEAIEELCARLGGEPGAPDPLTCAAAVRAREQLIGTGTGGGLAIPHARMEGLDRPLLVFGRSREGIDWDAPDGSPVHLVFMLLSPAEEDALQLQILAALARALSHGAVRELLIDASSDQEVWSTLEQMLGGERVESPTGARVRS